MRKRVIWTVALVTASASLVTPAAATQRGHDHHTCHVSNAANPNRGDCFVEFGVQFAQVKKLNLGGPPGPSLGDEMILSLDVFQNGRKIGVGDGTFTTTRVTGSGPNAVVESQGIFTLRLPDGQLSIQFIQLRDNEQILPVAVTGGSGVFRGAGGDGTITKGNNSGVVRLHLQFA
ncbi:MULTISPECIES: hypothetical protein [Streptomyces]|uniref:hypothetical protein n=1 Tax=Streptomyces TaxID=1883 RepID=UPI0029AC7365|nr:hypothetical protein [Streptomyces sp. AK02-04a]MDX3755247.1 hypothetical protein [Streptomyces sp. AK02-04a]